MKKTVFTTLCFLLSLCVQADSKENCIIKSKWTSHYYMGDIHTLFYKRVEKHVTISAQECLDLVKKAARTPRKNRFNGYMGNENPAFVKFDYNDDKESLKGEYEDMEFSGKFTRDSIIENK